MKWAQSLIRISDYEVEALRKRVAEVSARRVACEMILESLERESAQETENARQHAEAGWYLVGFREGWKLRQAKAAADLAAVQIEEQGARDALTEAYEALKKVEHVAEASRLAGVKAAAARETAALDEIALRRAMAGPAGPDAL
jgi:flagellar FliJ protein